MKQRKIRTAYLMLLVFVSLMSMSFSAYADTGASGTCNVMRGQGHQLVCDAADEATTCVRLNRELDPPGQFGVCRTLRPETGPTRCECVPNATAAQTAQIARVQNALATSDYFAEVSNAISSDLACAQIVALANDMLAAHVALSALGPISFFDAKTLGALDEILLGVFPFASLVDSCGEVSFPSSSLFSFFLSLKQQMIGADLAF